MRLVITGANGFLGKNLIRNLPKEKVDFVRLLDIRPLVVEESALHCESHALDLADSKLQELIEEGEIVIHLAWRSNPSLTGANVEEERRLNWDASQHLIEVCSKNKAKLIFISSGGTVYGKPLYTPIDENHSLAPISAYGQVKLEVEREIMRLNSENGLEYVILRPSNLYGPGFSTEKGLGVIGHWVKQIKDDRPLQIVGDGEQIRDFIHVDDLSRAILSSMEMKNEILNVGTGAGISLNNLKSVFEEVIGKEIEVNYQKGRNFDVASNVLSIERIIQKTGWKPLVSLNNGIAQLIK